MIIDNNLLDEVSGKARENERLRMNFNFHESWDSKAQIMLNALEPGTFIPIGRHQNVDETFVVLRGTVLIHFYDDSRNITMECVLDPKIGHYGIVIPKGTWHQVECLESGTVIFESREGPYSPLSDDDIMN